LCRRMEVIIPVDQTSMALPRASVFDDFRVDIAERVGERCELLFWRVGKFCSMKDKKRGMKSGKWMGTCMRTCMS